MYESVSCSIILTLQILLLLFSCSVITNSLWPHRLQHTRLPCPSPSPRVYSNSCPLSQWCHPSISSSVVPFSSCLQSFLASGYLLMSQLFTAISQSIGASTSASVLLTNNNYRKLTKPITWITALSHSTKLCSMCHVGPPKIDGSWWKVLTKCGPLEKGMANHFSILAWRNPWTVWNGKKIWQWKINSPGQYGPICYLRRVQK